MKLTATLPDGGVKSLVWIKDWNFYWQNNYMYREPVRLPQGTRLDIVSRYDNSSGNPLNPSSPPRRVLFGNGSTDEMCFGIFQVLADRRSDEQKIGMALMQSAFKQWNESTIDAEGRKHILDEAGQAVRHRRQDIELDAQRWTAKCASQARPGKVGREA